MFATASALTCAPRAAHAKDRSFLIGGDPENSLRNRVAKDGRLGVAFELGESLGKSLLVWNVRIPRQITQSTCGSDSWTGVGVLSTSIPSFLTRFISQI